MAPCQQRLNLPGPPDYHCPCFLSHRSWKSCLCSLSHFLTSLSLFRSVWSGFPPPPRDFPNQGHCGLHDTDMIQCLSYLISLQHSRWLSTSPFLIHFFWRGSQGGALAGYFLLSLWEPLLSSWQGPLFAPIPNVRCPQRSSLSSLSSRNVPTPHSGALPAPHPGLPLFSSV